MAEIHATDIGSFREGKRRLMRVTKAGNIQHQTKDGLVDVGFPVGSVILADHSGNIIVSPTSLDGAVDLASRIIDGDAQSITNPLALLALATAVVGFIGSPVPPDTEVITAPLTSHRSQP